MSSLITEFSSMSDKKNCLILSFQYNRTSCIRYPTQHNVCFKKKILQTKDIKDSIKKLLLQKKASIVDEIYYLVLCRPRISLSLCILFL